jgi:hypothetical protein
VKISTELELQNNATALLDSMEPVLITREGKMAGLYLPSGQDGFPEDLKKNLFEQFSQQIGILLQQSGVDPAEVESDFKEWRKNRLEADR